MTVRKYLPLCCGRTALEVSEEEGSYRFALLPLVFRKFIRVIFYFSWLCPVWLTLFCTTASLKVPAVIAYDVVTKVLDSEIFPQHTIADLKLWHYIYCFVQSGEAFTVKENAHTHKHTHTNTHTRTHTHTYTCTHTHTYTQTHTHTHATHIHAQTVI